MKHFALLVALVVAVPSFATTGGETHMHRIDGLDHVSNMFDEGDPVVPRLATQVTVDWLNDVQENVARAVEKSGKVLAKGDYDQLSKAIGAKMWCLFRFGAAGSIVMMESEGITGIVSDLTVNNVIDVTLDSAVVGWPVITVQDMGYYTAAGLGAGPVHGVPNWQATPVPGLDAIAGFSVAFFAADGSGLDPDAPSLENRMFAIVVQAKSRAAI